MTQFDVEFQKIFFEYLSRDYELMPLKNAGSVKEAQDMAVRRNNSIVEFCKKVSDLHETFGLYEPVPHIGGKK